MDVNVPFIASESWDASMHERMRWLRENDPVHWSEQDDIWLITKFADVSYVSKHQESFTSCEGVRPGHPVRIGLIDEAEPRHGALRSLINRGFTPRMVKKLEITFREIVTDAIDKVASKGECDFVESLAVPLPLLLIAAMMGIRPQDYGRFHKWSDDMVAGDGNFGDPEIMARASTAFLEYSTYVTALIEDRRRCPQDDLLSILIGAKDDGVLTQFDARPQPGGVVEENMELANDELIMLMVVLLVAGNETTRNGISGGMQLLIENPDERDKLLRDPSLLRSAVEEMVRLVSPVNTFSRTVVHDTELRDKQLKAGQKVLLLYGSANRDADEFEDPEAFKVDRAPHHLGFGIGSHFCLGANLARMEMRVAFEEILRRMPNMEYTSGGPVMQPSALVRACTQMKVRFDAEPSPA